MARENQTNETPTKTMTKPLVLELKALLTYILNSDNTKLRVKTLEFTMELLSELEMDWRPAEQALKEELKKHHAQADDLIETILDAVNKEEYGKK